MTDGLRLALGPLRRVPADEPPPPPAPAPPRKRRRGEPRTVGTYAGMIAITGYVPPETKADLDLFRAKTRLSTVETVNRGVSLVVGLHAFAADYRARFGEEPPESFLEEALADWVEKRQAARDFGKT